jgi:hypothetical protein
MAPSIADIYSIASSTSFILESEKSENILESIINIFKLLKCEIIKINFIKCKMTVKVFFDKAFLELPNIIPNDTQIDYNKVECTIKIRILDNLDYNNFLVHFMRYSGDSVAFYNIFNIVKNNINNI